MKLAASLSVVLLALAASQPVHAQSTSPNVPADWRTRAEQTEYRETPTYAETLDFVRRLERASRVVRVTEFGKTGEGRALPLVVAAKGGAFTPAAARAAGKLVMLVQANIHAGETDGLDAGLALLRDMAITKSRESLLDHVTLLFIPVYNVDGFERRSPYNRINQNGPAEMGWRGTATNLNLNRDYMKADAPETRAWLRLWNEWSPDLFVDCHVTDGADFRYNITYQYEQHQNVPAPLLGWMKSAFDSRVVPAAERPGNLLAPYITLRDSRDPAKGIEGFIETPRYSTGYTPVRNRPGLLIETHMLKDYRTRVRGTYDLVAAVLSELNRDPAGLRRVLRETDEAVAAEGRTYDTARRVPLRLEFTDKTEPFKFKGVEFRVERSDVSGGDRIVYGDKPVDLTVPYFNDARVTASVAPPLYYVVPPQWADVISVLAAHGLRLKRLAAPATLDVESYRFSDVRWSPAPFEGRNTVTQKNTTVRERRLYPEGSVVVPVAQPAARVAVHLLEPDSPDSFVSWGFFNPIFEQKEYGESYVLEKLAREMMAKDENLRREFERRVANDPQFAKSQRARLSFFYDRSPYADARLNLYPVGRVTTHITAKMVDYR
ncbi:MAG TPA: M14 family metallopeptidase [Pyrinomonadaceae bacterium]|jgi:murein tripeptide amidase MpaA|nr:M14 family metallopeptidase [Pyrinomonadaceae bacterium]